MTDWQGKFVWYELMTTDPKAAETFYSKVFGWEMHANDLSPMAYTHIAAGTAQIGGIFEIPQPLRDQGTPPNWTAYIAVDDVDSMAEKVKLTGGHVHKGPEDIPNVGRMAVVTDPAGAYFILFKGSSGQIPATQGMAAHGTFGWNECHGHAPEQAFPFYAELFPNWTKTEALDMGPVMGTYQVFTIDGVPSGGMMKKTPEMPIAAWIYYVSVPDIDAAHQRVVENGGQILFGPSAVPGGMWIVQAFDPQLAMFAMLGPRGT